MQCMIRGTTNQRKVIYNSSCSGNRRGKVTALYLYKPRIRHSVPYPKDAIPYPKNKPRITPSVPYDKEHRIRPSVPYPIQG